MRSLPGQPWILVNRAGRDLEARCTRCGEHVALDEPDLADFAAVHAHPEVEAPRQLRGLGDLVARATAKLGIEPCSPCAQRQAALNRILPRFW